MLKSLVEMMSGTDNKSAGKINLTVKCSGLKLEYEYDGPKRHSDAKVVEKCEFELENFEVSGECEASMSGFFKLVCDIKDAVANAGTEAGSTKTAVANNKCIEGEYLRQLINDNKESIKVRTWPVSFKILDGNELKACCEGHYDEDEDIKMAVAFDCKRLYNFSDADIVNAFLDGNSHYRSNKEKDAVALNNSYTCGSGNVDIHYTSLHGVGEHDTIVVILFK